jgi:hypothetical protein
VRNIWKGLIGLVIFVSFLLVPVIEVEVVPAWRFQLVEANGVPIQDTTVRQYWKHFSFEWNWFTLNDDSKVTDRLGFVEFPRRGIRISLATFLIGSVWEKMPGLNPHVEGGAYSFVQCDNISGCESIYRSGRELPTKVIRAP